MANEDIEVSSCAAPEKQRNKSYGTLWRCVEAVGGTGQYANWTEENARKQGLAFPAGHHRRTKRLKTWTSRLRHQANIRHKIKARF